MPQWSLCFRIPKSLACLILWLPRIYAELATLVEIKTMLFLGFIIRESKKKHFKAPRRNDGSIHIVAISPTIVISVYTLRCLLVGGICGQLPSRIRGSARHAKKLSAVACTGQLSRNKEIMQLEADQCSGNSIYRSSCYHRNGKACLLRSWALTLDIGFGRGKTTILDV